MTSEGDSGERQWRLVRADPDAVPASVRTESERPAVTRRRRVLRLLAALAVIVVLASVTWVVYGTGLFAVTAVRVTGVHVLTADQVRTTAQVPTGTPLARLDTDAIGGRVAKLAPVATVVVERDWPHSVVIRVREREPAAVVPSSGQFLVVDAGGVVFDVAGKRPRDLPLLDVSSPGPKDVTTRDALRVLGVLTPQLRGVLVKLSAPSATRIQLHLTKHRTVIWGDAEHSTKKAQVATVLLKRPVHVIDVSAPDVVTTR